MQHNNYLRMKINNERDKSMNDKIKKIKCDKEKRDQRILYILLAVSILSICLFIFYGLNARNYQYNLSRRVPKVIAIILTGGAIALSSVIFQTVTNNRILTPSILGLDSLYNFAQTISIFVFGVDSFMMLNKHANFLVSVSLMLLGTFILYKLVFSKDKNIFTLLLVGTVVGTLFRSLSSFMSMLIDPNDFIVLQSKMFASFNNVNTEIILIVIIIFSVIVFSIFKDINNLDVMLLGREQSINLGVNHDKLSKKLLVYVAILVSVSTALVGPITFLGLIVSNLSYVMMKSYKHKYVICCSVMVSVISLVLGQFIVEKILNFSTTVSIIINFIGGIYFIYLLVRKGKSIS